MANNGGHYTCIIIVSNVKTNMFRFQCLAAIARIQGEINMLVASSKTFCVPMVNYKHVYYTLRD